jgi:hypothetical protein
MIFVWASTVLVGYHGPMKIGPTTQFLIIGAVVGGIVPFFLAICLFGTTLQGFVANPQPTQGYWSGAPTPLATPVPSPVQAWTSQAFASGGGTVFVLWSILGAFAGEAVALRSWGKEWDRTRRAWLGAVAGSVIFIGIALCGFLR